MALQVVIDIWCKIQVLNLCRNIENSLGLNQDFAIQKRMDNREKVIMRLKGLKVKVSTLSTI